MRTRHNSSDGPSTSTAARTSGVAARACAGLVRAYQLVVRPVLPPSCRFVPSCSQYARTAFLRHGAIRGAWLTLRRTARCNAWHPGGYDPVPGSGG